MATDPMATFMHQLRRGVLAADGAGLTDGQLLTLFIENRDEGAFEALVRRHGPMVMGVCRRVLRNAHDAEDAFQATFLVLVRKAASIRPRGMVGNWLYGVACRTAAKARARHAKRRAKELAMPAKQVRPDETSAELQALVEHELRRLPDKYRAALVLCELEGRTRKEAARRLGWPEGTVATRLIRARALLAKRLTRQGVGLPAALLTLGFSQGASASLPA